MQTTERQADRQTTDGRAIAYSERKKVKVNLDICKAPLNTKSVFQSTQIWQHTVLPAIKPYLPLLPSRKASPPFSWYSFYRPTEGRRLSRPIVGWLHTEIKCRPRKSNPDTVTHPSTNRAQRRLTSLIETNALPLRQNATLITSSTHHQLSCRC